MNVMVSFCPGGKCWMGLVDAGMVVAVGDPEVDVLVGGIGVGGMGVAVAAIFAVDGIIEGEAVYCTVGVDRLQPVKTRISRRKGISFFVIIFHWVMGSKPHQPGSKEEVQLDR
jgi:hypothetical protein